MICRTWRGGFLLFTVLLVIQLVYASTRAQPYSPTEPSGKWVQSDGSEIAMRCPGSDKYGDRALKMPSGCVVHVPGVWVSLDRFAALKSESKSLQATLEATKSLLEQTRADLLSERQEFSKYLRRTENKLDSIGDDLRSSRFSWTSAGVGLAFGASMCGGVLIGGSL